MATANLASGSRPVPLSQRPSSLQKLSLYSPFVHSQPTLGFFFPSLFSLASAKKKKKKSLFFLASDGRLRADMDNAGPHYRRLEEQGGGGRGGGWRIWRGEAFSSSHLNMWLPWVVRCEARRVGVGGGGVLETGLLSLATLLTGRRPRQDGTL